MFFAFFCRLTITKAWILALSIATPCLVLAVVAAIGSQTTRQAGSQPVATTSQSTGPLVTTPISAPPTLTAATLAAEGKVATENGAFSLGPPDMQGRQGTFRYFGFSNEWQGLLNSVKFEVFAGARNSYEHLSGFGGPEVKDGTGGLFILAHTENGTDEEQSKGGTYFAPGDIGSLRIAGEVHGILLLQTMDGLSLHFDLDSWNWVNQ
jgi:hypothetical protein